MRLVALTLFVSFVACASPPALELHEWGTFTSVAGPDGRPVPWTAANTEDLPGFVYRLSPASCRGFRACREEARGKGSYRTLIRMETPVIYFYAPRALDVTLAVRFPRGQMTEWYPSVRGQTAQALDWGTFRVDPAARPALPTEAGHSHYYAAREVEAAPLLVKGQRDGVPFEEWERFLFYRGVGDFAPPLTARLTRTEVSLVPAAPLGRAFLFERRGARLGVVAFDAERAVTLARPPLDAKVEDARALLVERLVASGLYAPEARAMVKTWDDSWFEEGARVFYLVPRAQTDELLPLTVSPAPAAVVRTMVGRLELISPEAVEAVARRLPAEPTLAALQELERALGRFGGPLIERALGDTRPELRRQWDATRPRAGALVE